MYDCLNYCVACGERLKDSNHKCKSEKIDRRDKIMASGEHSYTPPRGLRLFEGLDIIERTENQSF